MLLILDEVMSGMGRTGTLHACEQEGIAPDLLCVAKGLGAGYQPIGATLVSGQIFEAFRDGSGFFQHGHTYMGHPMACAAALAVQRAIDSRQLLAKVRLQGGVLSDALHERFGNHPHVGDIRGRGLFQGIELVAERTTKEPFDPGLKLHARIKAAAMEGGLICYPRRRHRRRRARRSRTPGAAVHRRRGRGGRNRRPPRRGDRRGAPRPRPMTTPSSPA